MSHVYSSDATAVPEQASSPPEASLGTLVSQMSAQIPELIRSEIRLAQAEVTAKGKRAGIGIGMFSAAGVLALFGFGVLITTAILLLDLVLPAWAAALVVAVVLLAVAGIAALLGKKKVAEAAPPLPERALENIKEDVATVKGAAARGERR
jgi:uncharacterized membrane protein YqjE